MENDWDVVRNDRGWSSGGGTGMGILRIALLFGSVAVALALILAPILEGETRYADGGQPFGVDNVATGSIGKGNTYTIRRSVLQSSPDAVCLIDSNGRQAGDC